MRRTYGANSLTKSGTSESRRIGGKMISNPRGDGRIIAFKLRLPSALLTAPGEEIGASFAMGTDDTACSLHAAAAVVAAAALGGDPAVAFRAAADAYATLRLPVAARFLADKATDASCSPDDALRLARVHANAGQHRRALHVLAAAGMGAGGGSLTGRLLAAQCEFAAGELDACLAVLGEDEAADVVRVDEASDGVAPRLGAAADTPEVRAALAVMRGRVYEEMENVERAAWWYKRALICDVFCYDAFSRLADAGLASPEETARFTEDLRLGRGTNTSLWAPTPGASPKGACGGTSRLKPHHIQPIAIAGATAVAANAVASSSSARASLRRSPRRAGGSDPTAKLVAAAPSPASPPLPPSTRSPTRKRSQVTQAENDEAHAWVCSFYRVRVDCGVPMPQAPDADSGTAPANSHKDAARTPVTGSAVVVTKNAADCVSAEPWMRENADVRALRAVRFFASLDFEECVRLTRSILERDPYVEDRVLRVHLAALVELDERQDLFVLAHSLVDNRPRDVVSWMAVGYYYFTCGKLEMARRYLQKATSIDSRLGSAWFAYGHVFAALDESDQAMAAYRTAARLFPGDQLPMLFMGMEYARQSSPVHATTFLQSAREACPTDPAPRHELGVIAYRSGDLRSAVTYFKASVALWEANDGLKEFVLRGGRRTEAEEATYFNLGHCYRRLREFDQAKDCYERALSLRPRSASTCTALGMTLHAMEDPSAAVAMYHRALRYNPEDAIAVVGLDRALTDMALPVLSSSDI